MDFYKVLIAPSAAIARITRARTQLAILNVLHNFINLTVQKSSSVGTSGAEWWWNFSRNRVYFSHLASHSSHRWRWNGTWNVFNWESPLWYSRPPGRCRNEWYICWWTGWNLTAALRWNARSANWLQLTIQTMEWAIGMARRAMAPPDFKLVAPAIQLALPEFLKNCQLI